MVKISSIMLNNTTPNILYSILDINKLKHVQSFKLKKTNEFEAKEIKNKWQNNFFFEVKKAYLT